MDEAGGVSYSTLELEEGLVMKVFRITSIAVLVGSVAGVGVGGPIFESAFIFAPENIHVHSSSIVECSNGDLLACWYHGHGERSADDALIQGARKPKEAKRWSDRFLMADTPGFPDCNPILFVAPDKQLWMIWPVILNNQWGSALLKFRTSSRYDGLPGAPEWDWQDNILLRPDDFEREFKEAVEQFKLLRKTSKKIDEYLIRLTKASEDKWTVRSGWMPRIHPLALPTGRILLGLYSDVFDVSLIAITDNNGKTWSVSSPLVGGGNVQPSLVRKKDGTLVAMHRENGLGDKIRLCESTDDGQRWGRVYNADLPNPGSSVEVIATKSGSWVLAYNDTTKGRHSLAVSLSED